MNRRLWSVVRLIAMVGAVGCSDSAHLSRLSDPQTECENGQPIRVRELCNGFRDCADGSDESFCDFFTCENGKTIDVYDLCDGYSDCADSEDEDDCF